MIITRVPVFQLEVQFICNISHFSPPAMHDRAIASATLAGNHVA